MSAIDTLRAALYGNPPRADFKPDRDGVIQAFSELADQFAVGALGISYFPNKAAMDAVTPGADDPKLALVNDDATPANNTLYTYRSGAWDVFDEFVEAISSATETLVTTFLKTMRDVVSGEMYIIRKEGVNFRIYASAGLLENSDEANVVIPAINNQVLAPDVAALFNKNTNVVQYKNLTDIPSWALDQDYVLLFANVGGRVVGSYKDARHIDDFYVVKTASSLTIYGPELEPYSNRHMRLSYVKVTDTDLHLDSIWRGGFQVLCERTSISSYADIAVAFSDAYGREFRLKANNEAVIGASEGNVSLIGELYLFFDGKRYAAGDVITTRTPKVGIGQHWAFYEYGSPTTLLGYHSTFYNITIAGYETVIDFQFVTSFETTLGPDGLEIGVTQPRYNSSGIGCFDTVYRGPAWVKHVLNDAPLGTAYYDQSTIVKYEGAGILVAGAAIVAGKGLACHIEIMPGSDWTDDNRSTLVSPDVYGTTFFNWVGRPLGPIIGPSKVQGRVQWRFTFKS